MYRICSLDGTIQPEIVFEPLELNPYQIESFFGDATIRKILKILTGNFSGFSLNGKLFVSDSGITILGYLNHEDKIIVLIRVLGKSTLVYEMDSDKKFKVFFVDDGEISEFEFKLDSEAYCNKKDKICWALPVYALLPELYPEVCDEEVCSRMVIP